MPASRPRPTELRLPRRWPLLLAITLLAPLAACGDGGEAAPSDGVAAAETSDDERGSAGEDADGLRSSATTQDGGTVEVVVECLDAAGTARVVLTGADLPMGSFDGAITPPTGVNPTLLSHTDGQVGGGIQTTLDEASYELTFPTLDPEMVLSFDGCG